MSISQFLILYYQDPIRLVTSGFVLNSKSCKPIYVIKVIKVIKANSQNRHKISYNTYFLFEFL